MPGLGYKGSSTFRKIDIAIIQLNDAISLFIEERFLSSLTLAGASESVISGLLAEAGDVSSGEEAYSLLRTFRKTLDLDPEIDRLPKKDFFKKWNNAKNTLKHHDIGDPEQFSLNACDEAYWMIGRCLRGAKLLGVDVEMKFAFQSWVKRNARL